MTYTIVQQYPHAIFKDKQGPFITLYQTTHRTSPDNKQDSLRFKNLVNQVEKSLKEQGFKNEVLKICEPLHHILEDKEFWINSYDGICVLVNPHQCIVYKLDIPVQELAIVADSFHIKPLIRIFQGAQTYLILGLSKHEFHLYQADKHKILPIEFEEHVITKSKDLLGDIYSDISLTHGSYGGTKGAAIFHGFEDKQAEIDKDTEKFFSYVDQFVIKNYSQVLKVPLVLVAVNEHHSHFQKISKNSYLLEDGIRQSMESLDVDALRKKAWTLVNPMFTQKVKKEIEKFNYAKSNGTGSDDLETVIGAALENRIATIMIEEEMMIYGEIDPVNHQFKLSQPQNGMYNDILDDLAEMVLLSKGEVFVLTQKDMPTQSGVAATFRF